MIYYRRPKTNNTLQPEECTVTLESSLPEAWTVMATCTAAGFMAGFMGKSPVV